MDKAAEHELMDTAKADVQTGIRNQTLVTSPQDVAMAAAELGQQAHQLTGEKLRAYIGWFCHYARMHRQGF